MHKIPPEGQYFLSESLITWLMYNSKLRILNHYAGSRRRGFCYTRPASLSLSLSLSQQLSALLNLNHSLSTVYRKFSQAERERERERERESERLMPDDEMRRLWTSVVFQQHSTFDDYNGRSLSYIPRNAERRFRVYYIYFSQHNYIIKP